MKPSGAIQIVIVLMLVASAASCEVAKEYSSRVFKPAAPQKKSDSLALRFMEFDSRDASDSIDLKDFVNKEIRETDQILPPKDTLKTEAVTVENKPLLKGQQVDGTKRGTARNRKTRE